MCNDATEAPPTTIWGVTGYDIGGNSGCVVCALFTTEAAADEYAKERDEYSVEEFDLYEKAPAPYTYWHRGAHVYPDGEVEDWAREHSAQPPGRMAAVDDRLDFFDGHLQGHCGFHVSIFGTDREAVEVAFNRQVEAAQTKCDGRCLCGRTENYVRHFYDTETIQVRLVGGPSNGEIRPEEASKSLLDSEGDPCIGSFVVCFGDAVRQADGSTVSRQVGTYGPPEKDNGDWIRRYAPSQRTAG